MEYPNIAGVNYESMADGEGMRAAIFFSGCSHHCPGCHNKAAQDPLYGNNITDSDIDDISSNIVRRPFIRGITLTGGDPLFCPAKTLNFMNELTARTRDKYSCWIYTGYTWEEVKTNMAHNKALKELIITYCDVLIDGQYVAALADRTLMFRGSSNQRIIDVPKTLKAGRIVLYENRT